MPLVYVILFYFTFFMCFLCFVGLWKKIRYLWKFGLKEQKEEKMESEEAIVHRKVRSNAPRVIERTCA
jgi:hypothetical protein